MNYRFQLAALQIDFICEMPTPNDVRRGLETLPDTLKDAYGEIYKRILAQKGSAPRLALGAFRWIRCSYEPLCSETLLDAITVEIASSDQGEFSRKDTITVNGLLKACQNLLIFDKQLNVFRFAHLSVDEYLEKKLPKVDSHSEIAIVCLSLLCTPGSWDTYDKTLRTREGCHSDRHLLLYSAVFWPWHFSLGRDTNGFEMLICLCKKLMSETNHQRWLEYHRFVVGASRYTEVCYWRRVLALQKEKDDALSSVCVFGLSRMFTTISGSKPLIERARIVELLCWASEFGDLEIASLLIDSGAYISATSGSGLAPLRASPENGQEAVARLRIDHDVIASAAKKDGSTPLHFAALHGHEAVAQLLIGHGAIASAAKKNGSTPLHFAALRGHEAVARLLIDHGAIASAADEDGSTPLHNAAWCGHEAVARLLIDHGAIASAADKDGWTPLHNAAENGHEAVARLLIGHGAIASAAEKDGSTPLHLAAKNGHEAVALLLRDQGATVTL